MALPGHRPKSLPGDAGGGPDLGHRPPPAQLLAAIFIRTGSYVVDLCRPLDAGPYAHLPTYYYEEQRVCQVDNNAELLYVRGLALAARQGSDGLLPAEVLQFIARGLRSKVQAIDSLVRVGLWTPVDAQGGYQIADWLKHNPSAEEISAARRLEESRRQWEADRKRQQRKSMRAGERPFNVPPDVPRDVPRDVPVMFSPPPKGAGGENKPRVAGASRPLASGALARTRADSAPSDRSSSSPSGDRNAHDYRQRPIEPEADWRAPRPVAAKPPDLGQVRRRLADASANYHNKGRRNPPGESPSDSGGGEDK
jgi:hypothetical protein